MSNQVRQHSHDEIRTYQALFSASCELYLTHGYTHHQIALMVACRFKEFKKTVMPARQKYSVTGPNGEQAISINRASELSGISVRTLSYRQNNNIPLYGKSNRGGKRLSRKPKRKIVDDGLYRADGRQFKVGLYGWIYEKNSWGDWIRSHNEDAQRALLGKVVAPKKRAKQELAGGFAEVRFGVFS